MCDANHAHDKGKPRAAPTHGRKLALAELWERSLELGQKSPSESAAIVRRLRDERARLAEAYDRASKSA